MVEVLWRCEIKSITANSSYFWPYRTVFPIIITPRVPSCTFSYRTAATLAHLLESNIAVCGLRNILKGHVTQFLLFNAAICFGKTNRWRTSYDTASCPRIPFCLKSCCRHIGSYLVRDVALLKKGSSMKEHI